MLFADHCLYFLNSLILCLYFLYLKSLRHSKQVSFLFSVLNILNCFKSPTKRSSTFSVRQRLILISTVSYTAAYRYIGVCIYVRYYPQLWHRTQKGSMFFSASFFQCRHWNYKQSFSISSFCRSNILLQNIYPVLDELKEAKIFFRTWRGGLVYWKTKDTLLNYFDIIALFSSLIKCVTPK